MSATEPHPDQEQLSGPSTEAALERAQRELEAFRLQSVRAQRRLTRVLVVPLIAIISGTAVYTVWKVNVQEWRTLVPILVIAALSFGLFAVTGTRLKKWRDSRKARLAEAKIATVTAEQLLAAAGASADQEFVRVPRNSPEKASSPAVSPTPQGRAPHPLAESPVLEATVLATASETTTAGPGLPQFEDYEILGEIGRGGMGCVYKAKHKRHGRVVALKTVLAGRSLGRGEIARFEAEVHSAARLDHPGIVPVYEAGESNGKHFFTMAYVNGDSLADRIKRGGIEPNQAVFFLVQAARAVAFAHRHGVIHRDIKPGNILLDRDGTVRVADFGLARQLDAADVITDLPIDQSFAETFQTVARLTVTGAVLGTPAYMAPEQALDTKRAKEPADIWALGAVLYASLTGRPPFIGGNVMETLTLVIEADPPPLRQLAPQVDHDLEAICRKCLSKDPQQRFASADELVDDLERWKSGQTPHAARLDLLERWQRWDAAYPEVLPLATGIVAPWLCGVQEGIFLGATLAASRWRSQWPNRRWRIGSTVVFAAITIVSGFLIDFLRDGPRALAANVDTEVLLKDFTSLSLMNFFLAQWGNIHGDLVRTIFMLLITGIVLGHLWCIGVQAAADRGRRWTFHLLTLAGLGCGIGLYFVYPELQRQLRNVTDVEYWNYHSVWRSLSLLGTASRWLIALAALCGVASVFLAVIVARRRKSLEDRSPLISEKVLTLCISLVGLALLVAFILAIAGLKTYSYFKLACLSAGPLSAAILILVLSFSAGSFLSHVLHRYSPRDDAHARQGRFIGRLAAALTGLVTLLVIIVGMPQGHPVALDVSGYFGAGPLLTMMEYTVSRLGVPIEHGWPIVFLGKFALLVVPMAIAATVVTQIVERRRSR